MNLLSSDLLSDRDVLLLYSLGTLIVNFIGPGATLLVFLRSLGRFIEVFLDRNPLTDLSQRDVVRD